jgi:RNA polymerase sigma-70 factor, ECF subfamily
MSQISQHEAQAGSSATIAPVDDAASDDGLVARLLAGDELAFDEVVAAWSPVMLHLARGYVSTRQSAEDVVQDAWLGVINGLAGFQGRSSLRSWTFSILINRAKTRGARDARIVASAAVTNQDHESPTVDPARFQNKDGEYPGHWTSTGAPRPWDEPEGCAVGRETLGVVDRALDDLPMRQRLVVTMRDVHGMTADEVCAALNLSPQNQRVLLHRGRATVRAAVETYLAEPDSRGSR